MSPAQRLRSALLVTLGCAGLASCGGSDLFSRTSPERTEVVANRPAADAEAAREDLATLQSLLAATPAAQAELLQNARAAAESAPTTANRLRVASLLALPGHPGADPVAARRQLSELLARPELLLPAERALAAVLLASVDDRLVLAAEARRVDQDAAGRDKDRAAAATAQKRLQTEQDENARLKRALDDLQKKLDAVTQVERSITGRGNPPKP